MKYSLFIWIPFWSSIKIKYRLCWAEWYCTPSRTGHKSRSSQRSVQPAETREIDLPGKQDIFCSTCSSSAGSRVLKNAGLIDSPVGGNPIQFIASKKAIKSQREWNMFWNTVLREEGWAGMLKQIHAFSGAGGPNQALVGIERRRGFRPGNWENISWETAGTRFLSSSPTFPRSLSPTKNTQSASCTSPLMGHVWPKEKGGRE